MSFISRNILPLLSAAALILLAGCVEENLPGKGNGGHSAGTSVPKIINTPKNAVEGQLLVCMSANATVNAQAIAAQAPEGMRVKSFKPVFHATEHNAKYLRKYGLDRWYCLEFEGAALEKAAATMAEFGSVSRVQYNTMAACGENEKAAPAADTGSDISDLPFDDDRLVHQWHMINTGDKTIASAAVEGADIGVKDVWERLGVGGDNDIVVAVFDGPIKYTHEDLADNMWTNLLEKDGEEGVDDDGNGYIDDIHGWNFERDTCKIDWTRAEETGHGTHVAGIVAAVNNNGTGICGVAGGTGKGDGVRLMSCQILDGGRSTNANAAAHAFIYAADNGAHIAQCSWGYQGGMYESDYEYYYYYSIEYFAIQYFLDKERWAENEERLNQERAKKNLPARADIIDGPLVIFAAGNDGNDRSSYPGALMDCICVTGTGPDGMPGYYSNYGPGVNISAPGGDYYLNTSNSRGQVLSTCVSEAGYGDYAYMGGTSMACPHVSGVAALGLAYAKKLGKTFTREEFTAMLLSSVNDIDSKLNSGYKYLGIDPSTGTELAPRPYSSYQYKMGTGTIDAWKLMMNIEGTPVLMVKVGNELSYSLDTFFGGGSEYMTYQGVEIDRETMKALGITRKPYIKNGKLVINPGRTGSGKIKITAIAGGNSVAGSISGDMSGMGDIVTIPDSNGMGGMNITREISIVARGVASNGGWL